MPPLACEPYSAYVPPLSISSIFYNIPSSLDDDIKDENPPPPQNLPSASQLLIWVRSTWDETGSLAGDPANQRCTRSQFKRASSLLVQVPEKLDPETFEVASGHPDWGEAMNEEYRSSLETILGILFLFQKEENLSDAEMGLQNQVWTRWKSG